MPKKRIALTVINDLIYDQRMRRICTSLYLNGYTVLLIGRKSPGSPPLRDEPYGQKRLKCLFQTGKSMYIEYNIRVFMYLLFSPADALCAIDLDTILPCYFISRIKGIKRVYDAHELFTEQKEIVTRPAVRKLWLRVERFAVPRYEHGYTVNNFIAAELNRRYLVQYAIVRNLPLLETIKAIKRKPHFILYQGAVNEGRSFETLIPAMKSVKAPLVVCGEGNYFEKLKVLISEYELWDKVELRGLVPPDELKLLTPTAYIAVTLFENTGLNQYQSLANRFFDYIMAGVPQICVAYPQYEAINNEFDVAYMIPDTDAATISGALNTLLTDQDLYNRLRYNCHEARKKLNWQTEEKNLIELYSTVFSHPNLKDT